MIYKSLIALMFFVASNAYAQVQTGAVTTKYPSSTIDYHPPTTTVTPTNTGSSSGSSVVNEVGSCPQNTIRSLVHRSRATAGAAGAGSYIQCQDVASAYPCYNARISGGTVPAGCPAGSPLFQSQ